MTDKKKLFVCTVQCPYCNCIVDVLKEVEIINPAQKAEKREIYLTAKSVQTTLPKTNGGEEE